MRRPVRSSHAHLPVGEPGGNPAPYASSSEIWFYANITLANQTQASPCPDIVHLFVDAAANPPILREQTISDANPTTDAPPNCKYGSATAPYTATYSTRLVGKYIVNGIPTCTTPDPVFVYWYDDGSGTPVAYPPLTVPPLSLTSARAAAGERGWDHVRGAAADQLPGPVRDPRESRAARERRLQPDPEPTPVR